MVYNLNLGHLYDIISSCKYPVDKYLCSNQNNAFQERTNLDSVVFDTFQQKLSISMLTPPYDIFKPEYIGALGHFRGRRLELIHHTIIGCPMTIINGVNKKA